MKIGWRNVDDGRQIFTNEEIGFECRRSSPGRHGSKPQLGGSRCWKWGPNGAHYNLNIIGVPKDKTAAMDSNDGHRIFVKMQGKTKIMLAESDGFNVLDANGTDGNGAKFQLPNPDPDGDGITVYSVYARAFGTPGGKAKIVKCATGPGADGILGTADDEEVCSLDELTVERTKGKQKFENVSRELLYIYADITDDGLDNPELYPLFSDELQGYFWGYDNNGLKLPQLT